MQHFLDNLCGRRVVQDDGIQQKEYIIMEEKLVNILNEMAEYLSVPQMKKLQEVLLKNLSGTMAQKENIENAEYLR